MPSSRATAISGFVSMVKVTRPSISLGLMPASSHAASTACTASISSERPESFEKSVAPMPAMAVFPERNLVSPMSGPLRQHDGAGHVVADRVGPDDLHGHLVAVDL